MARFEANMNKKTQPTKSKNSPNNGQKLHYGLVSKSIVLIAVVFGLYNLVMYMLGGMSIAMNDPNQMNARLLQSSAVMWMVLCGLLVTIIITIPIIRNVLRDAWGKQAMNSRQPTKVIHQYFWPTIFWIGMIASVGVVYALYWMVNAGVVDQAIASLSFIVAALMLFALTGYAFWNYKLRGSAK